MYERMLLRPGLNNISKDIFILYISFFREKMHLKALSSLLKEDLWTCTRIYDEILFEYPLDSFALSMLYMSGLFTHQMDLLRNIPARVVTEYNKSDRFYG